MEGMPFGMNYKGFVDYGRTLDFILRKAGTYWRVLNEEVT